MGPLSSPFILRTSYKVLNSKSLLTRNTVLDTAFSQIAAKEANLPHPYRTTLSQLSSSFDSSLYSYCERIGQIPSSLCHSCKVEPHTTTNVFSSSSHPTPLTERDLWERPHLYHSFLKLDFKYILLPYIRGSSERVAQISRKYDIIKSRCMICYIR